MTDYSITIHAEDAADLQSKVRSLNALLNPNAPASLAVVNGPAEVSGTTASIHTESGADVVAPTPQGKAKLTADDLIAGMSLKPTKSSGLGDGSSVSPDDYVTHGGQVWFVAQTYRGSLVAVNEAGDADVLKTEDCAAAAQPGETKPRAGTAAALIDKEEEHRDAAAGVDAATANALRERATDLVSSEIISVDAVFKKLGELGAQNMETLTNANAKKFGEWLDAATAPAPEKDKAFGF